MSNPYQPQDPNNPYGSQPEQNYQQPYSGPAQAIGSQQPYGQPPVQPPPPYGQMPVAYGQQGYYTPAAVMIHQRPIGVSIIAIGQYIIAGLFGLLTLVAFFASDVLADYFGGAVSGVFIVIGIVLLLFVALLIALGIGLWRMRSWAHITTIIVYSLIIGLNILGIIGGATLSGSDVFRISLEIAIVVYLSLPATRAAFRR